MSKNIIDQDRKLFVKRLKIALILKDMTRKELAEKAGIGIASINQICSGHQVSHARMNALRRATGFNAVDFIMLAPGEDNV